VSDVVHRWLLGGGIGSGKSTVRRLLAEAGVHTIDADSIGHAILEPDGAAFSEVTRRWPSVVLDGIVDRASLAKIVFSDAEQLAELEAITHPYIFGTISGLVEEIVGVAIVEIPLLRKTPPGQWKRLVVDCDDKVRLVRLIARGMTEDDARARMESQPPRAEWLAVADMVVPNHGGMRDLVVAVERLMPSLQARSRS